MKEYDPIMWIYFCIGFIDLMLKGKILLEYATLFLPNEYKMNGKMMTKWIANIKIFLIESK